MFQLLLLNVIFHIIYDFLIYITITIILSCLLYFLYYAFYGLITVVVYTKVRKKQRQTRFPIRKPSAFHLNLSLSTPTTYIMSIWGTCFLLWRWSKGTYFKAAIYTLYSLLVHIDCKILLIFKLLTFSNIMCVIIMYVHHTQNAYTVEFIYNIVNALSCWIFCTNL